MVFSMKRLRGIQAQRSASFPARLASTDRAPRTTFSWYPVINTTKDTLKNAPGYRYDRTTQTWRPENAPASVGGREHHGRPVPGVHREEHVALRVGDTGAALGPRRARVALLDGCAQPVLEPSINAAAIRLLTRLGVEVVLAKDEGC